MKIKKGRFRGKEFKIEGTIKDVLGDEDLGRLILKGNMAAYSAIMRGDYTIDDAPFYYGKIGILGFILSHENIYGDKNEIKNV